jgi:hypothetical protein
MTILTKKSTIIFFKKRAKAPARPTFFELARKSIAKKKKGVGKNLSQSVDKTVYGV